MSDPSSLVHSMSVLAESAVRHAAEAEAAATLDYSDASVQRLEGLIRWHESLGLLPKDFEDLARYWGPYFGEVLRRNLGGQWIHHEDKHGKTVAFQAGSVTLFPFDKVRKRIAEGREHDLAEYYNVVKDQIAPGRKPRRAFRTSKPIALKPSVPKTKEQSVDPESGECTVKLRFLTKVSMTKKEDLRKLVKLFAAHPKYQPTHWGLIDGGARKPYDAEEFVTEVAALYPVNPDIVPYFPHFVRRKPPKYDGTLFLFDDFSTVDIDFPKLDEIEAKRDLFEFGRVLAEHVRAEFGVLHPAWPSVLGKGEYNNLACSLNKLQQFGPVGLCARTWLGPHIAGLIGKEALVKAGLLIRENSWGGFEVDLMDEPWQGDFKLHSRRLKKIMKALADNGVFGDYTDTPFNMKKGPRWQPIPVG